MTVSLRDLRGCFEGVIPSIIATLSADGEPNISYLSHVHFIDDAHVALSNQFFSKTADNVRGTGQASVLVVDARTGSQFLLSLRYVGATDEGDMFRRMAAQLRATSSREGLGEVMKLRSADLYEVESCRAVQDPPGLVPSPATARHPDRLDAAARLTAAIAAERDADTMIDRALDGLVDMFGFAGAIVLTPDETGSRLVLLGARGYVGETVGSEVDIGVGTIGIAAETGRAVRLSDMSRGRRFETAVLASRSGEARAVPFPSLREPQSQLAVPMISRDQLYGVLFLESEQRFAFSHEDEDALVLVAGQIAASLRLLELEGREHEGGAESAAPPALAEQGRPFAVRYYAFDDSLFIDDVYVVKGVAGRLLFHFLSDFVDAGKRRFTNREMRLDPRLRLPGVKDNLETRLILLRRRLDERGAPVRLQRVGRGVVGLELAGSPTIEIVRDAP